jgi:hypothetical protein
MSEKQIQRSIFKRLGGLQAVRLFRNNVGTAWTGEVTRLQDGSILIKNPRPLHAGLVKGSGDLIGWRKVMITAEMVGRPIAQFLSLEVKTKTGRATKGQKNWQAAVNAHGGLAGIVRSDDEALELATDELTPF